jgi:hypothetical protein
MTFPLLDHRDATDRVCRPDVRLIFRPFACHCILAARSSAICRHGPRTALEQRYNDFQVRGRGHDPQAGVFATKFLLGRLHQAGQANPAGPPPTMAHDMRVCSSFDILARRFRINRPDDDGTSWGHHLGFVALTPRGPRRHIVRCAVWHDRCVG